MPILLATVALLLGLALLILGLRGRRVGDHPHCTACGFDLFGLPPESVRCPECGGDTRNMGARETGRHVRRSRPLLVGVLLLLPSGAYLGVLATAMLGAFDLTPYKPIWWLASDATSPAAPLRQQAIKEIQTRLAANKLTATDGDRVAASVVALQTNPVSAWQPECGDLLSLLRSAGLVSDPLWKQYGKNAAPRLSMVVRPRVRIGDPIPFQIKQPGAPVGEKTRFYATTTQRDIRIGAVTLTLRAGNTSSISNSGPSWTTPSIDAKDYAHQLQPGRHRIVVVQERIIRDGYRDADLTLHTDTVTLEADFDLLPADQPTVALVDDPALKLAVMKSMSPRLTISSQGYLNVSTDVEKPPVGLGYRVTLTSGETRKDVGTIALAAGKQTSFHHGWVQAWPTELKTGSLLYEPDVTAAASTVNVFEIYNQPLQWENLPIGPQ